MIHLWKVSIGILKKETLYNNDITSLEQYIDIVKDWLIFYNTIRLKSNKKLRL